LKKAIDWIGGLCSAGRKALFGAPHYTTIVTFCTVRSNNVVC
jgi:hypothetical protein